MNRDVEQQVWQRVLGQQEPPRGNLRPMELEAMEAAAVYRKLAGQFSGKGESPAMELEAMEAAAVYDMAVFRQRARLGICTICRWKCLPACGELGVCPAVGAGKPPRLPPRRNRRRRRWNGGITAPDGQ